MVNAEKRRRTATPTHAGPKGAAPSLGEGKGPVKEAAEPSLASKLKYRFDIALSRGPLVVIG